MEEYLPVRDVSGGSIVVELKDVLGGRVGEKHPLVIGAPTYAIGDCYLLDHTVKLHVRVQTEQHPFVGGFVDFGVIHGAGPVSATGVDGSVIEAHPVLFSPVVVTRF